VQEERLGRWEQLDLAQQGLLHLLLLDAHEGLCAHVGQLGILSLGLLEIGRIVFSKALGARTLLCDECPNQGFSLPFKSPLIY
jgi:hypothetical protein